MSLPKVAIVGRPNVGKSSLLNRIARRRVSIVDPTPGVTRDRVSAVLEVTPPIDTPEGTESRLVEFIDTGGYGVYTAEGGRFDEVGADLARLTPEIEGQIRAARQEAALVLFVFDAQSGLTPLDRAVIRMMRSEGTTDRILVVANKVDGENWIAHAQEFAEAGLGEPWCVSATSGFGMRALLDEIWRRAEGAPEPTEEPELRLAIVGRRNVGKSSIVNALAGEERVIVSEIAGTTRDAIDVRVEIFDRSLVVIDTAGVRKRKSFADDIEYYANVRMLASIRRANVVCLMVDATAKISQVDQQLAQEITEHHKPCMIVVNKWDLVPAAQARPEDYLEYLTKELRGLDYAPIVFTSAAKGEGLKELLAMAFNLHEQAGHRESTGSLNRTFTAILKERGPSSRLGTEARIYYVSQIDVHPPTIVLKVNRPNLFRGAYERYLLNRARESLPFSEVPIRLIFTERDRQSFDELKAEARARDAAAELEPVPEEDEAAPLD